MCNWEAKVIPSFQVAPFIEERFRPKAPGLVVGRWGNRCF